MSYSPTVGTRCLVLGISISSVKVEVYSLVASAKHHSPNFTQSWWMQCWKYWGCIQVPVLIPVLPHHWHCIIWHHYQWLILCLHTGTDISAGWFQTIWLVPHTRAVCLLCRVQPGRTAAWSWQKTQVLNPACHCVSFCFLPISFMLQSCTLTLLILNESVNICYSCYFLGEVQ